MVKRAFPIGAVLLAFSGCVSLNEQTSVANQSPATPSMKSQIVDGASDVKRDPESIRNAEISWVVQDPNTTRLLVCVRAQRRDATTGGFQLRTRLVPFTSTGFIAGGGGAWDSAFCANPALRWQSFPEIQLPRN
jgi:hypothetical protein